MFCTVCQRLFRTKNAYQDHVSGAGHIRMEGKQSKNATDKNKRSTSRFIAEFHSHISRTIKYTEMNQLYKKYLSRGGIKVEETSMKSVEEAINELCGRISVIREDNKIMVKCLDNTEHDCHPVAFDLSKLSMPFNVRTVDKESYSHVGENFTNETTEETKK